MHTFISIVHVTSCVLLVLVVLIQSGKGAEISASFGGSSQTVFGSSGGANFFTRFTASLAAIFMITSLALTVIAGQNKKSVFDSGTLPATPTPAATAPTAAAAPTTATAAKPATAPSSAAPNAPKKP